MSDKETSSAGKWSTIDQWLGRGADLVGVAGGIGAFVAFLYPAVVVDYVKDVQSLIDQSAADVSRISENTTEISSNTEAIANSVTDWFNVTKVELQETSTYSWYAVEVENKTNRIMRDANVTIYIDGHEIGSRSFVVPAGKRDGLAIQLQDISIDYRHGKEFSFCLQGRIDGSDSMGYEYQTYEMSQGYPEVLLTANRDPC